ncbi:MFS transporter [Yinghuangia sp. ASG 101]|uniref:MFS transporter n=1 Tax=Yinghuangia sp. ASG 101 TaxID=2896848 RepID=UPI001E2BFBC9|nr:MFS transporter [Yinghuangia sp. ASG 101]UGQ15436.1 MFS transporter [Yinghuangia sp. ASG 101]
MSWFGVLPKAIAGRFRDAAHSKGAKESGLGKLIELHAINNAGDALVTIALATTVFFSVPTGEARDRVALYLLITMAPFALMAPVIGPLLDRLRRGRRVAIAVTMLARAVLAWMMAAAVEDGGLELYPEAFLVLMTSKAYGVSRSAVVPRLQPRSMSLVKVNSRITMFGLIGTLLAAPVAGGLKVTAGTPWIMYAATAVFVFGAILAFVLPAKVDSPEGEDRAAFTRDAPGAIHHGHFAQTRRRYAADTGTAESAAAPEGTAAEGADAGHGPPDAATGGRPADARPPGKPRKTKTTRRLRSVGPSVVLALWANASLRAFSGFLIMFLGFLLREEPVGGMDSKTALSAAVAAAAVGNAIGTLLGAWFKSKAPEAIIVGVVVVAAVSAVSAAMYYGLTTVIAVAAVAGLAQALGKLSLDAMIQRDIPEEVRTSAFARTETALQLAWVVGGGVGIVLPLNGTLGMGIAAAVLILTLVLTGRRLTTRRSRPARSPGFRLRGAR